MSPDHASETIEIRDPEIDAQAIMRQIRAKIRQRRAEAESQGLDYDAFLHGLSAAQGATRFDESFYHTLQQLGSSHDKIGVGLALTPSAIPLVGPLLQRVRVALHQLVIFYVNMLAGQQRGFNGHVAQAVRLLVKQLEADPLPGQVESLQRELDRLHERVEQLESRAERAER
ncbi:MAG: hypothetical protein JW900_06895 [Anaerolineae bacterium]|nr:hypothetical protein [Anaerolineae bacterium]